VAPSSLSMPFVLVGMAAFRAGVYKNADVRRQLCASAPLLFGRYGSIHFAYQLVSGPIQSASGMKLVTDGTVGPKGKHTEDFVFQGRAVPETAEVAPGSVEPSVHSHNILAEGCKVTRVHWEMEIPPDA